MVHVCFMTMPRRHSYGNSKIILNVVTYLIDSFVYRNYRFDLEFIAILRISELKDQQLCCAIYIMYLILLNQFTLS